MPPADLPLSGLERKHVCTTATGQPKLGLKTKRPSSSCQTSALIKILPPPRPSLFPENVLTQEGHTSLNFSERGKISKNLGQPLG